MIFYKSALFLLLTFALSAALFAEQQFSDNPVETNKPLLTTIHNSQLRNIMLRLNALAYDREFTQFELNKLRAEQIDKLIVVANELLSNTNRLTNILGESGLNEEEQLTFNAMANQLYKEALSLQHDINRSSQNLLDTCNTCHKLFRNR